MVDTEFIFDLIIDSFLGTFYDTIWEPIYDFILTIFALFFDFIAGDIIGNPWVWVMVFIFLGTTYIILKRHVGAIQ